MKIDRSLHKQICDEWRALADKRPDETDNAICSAIATRYGVKSGAIYNIVFRIHPEWKRGYRKTTILDKEKRIDETVKNSAFLHQFSPAWVGRVRFV